MHIYIDEAGVFVIPQQQECYVCCHVALLIPSSQVETVLYEFVRLRDSWGSTQVELKGSSLKEAQIDAVVDMLLRFDVVARVIAIDMARHTEASITQFKNVQAAGAIPGSTPYAGQYRRQYPGQCQNRASRLKYTVGRCKGWI